MCPWIYSDNEVQSEREMEEESAPNRNRMNRSNDVVDSLVTCDSQHFFRTLQLGWLHDFTRSKKKNGKILGESKSKDRKKSLSGNAQVVQQLVNFQFALRVCDSQKADIFKRIQFFFFFRQVNWSDENADWGLGMLVFCCGRHSNKNWERKKKNRNDAAE